MGRPRASEFDGSGDPRRDILDAATELISTVGYARATTRAIAAKAGLRQSSMFHYYPSKGHLLAALFERIIDKAVRLVTALDESDLPPVVKLYALSYGDVRNMASSETNIALLQFINEAQGERFERFWSDYARLRDAHARYLEEGVAQGSIVTDDVTMTTDLVLGVIDSVAMWFVPNRHDPHEVAGRVADTVVISVLSDPDDLARVRREAGSFLVEAGNPRSDRG